MKPPGGLTHWGSWPPGYECRSGCRMLLKALPAGFGWQRHDIPSPLPDSLAVLSSTRRVLPDAALWLHSEPTTATSARDGARIAQHFIRLLFRNFREQPNGRPYRINTTGRGRLVLWLHCLRWWWPT